MKNLRLFNFAKLLKDVPSDESLHKERCKEFLKDNPQLKHSTPWWCEQALASIGELPLVKVDGKYNALKTFAAAEDQWVRGLIYYIVHQSPSDFTSKGMGVYPQYGSYTPMFMAAFKQYKNVNYEEWDKESCKKLVPYYLNQLLNSSLPDNPPSREELLEDRSLIEDTTKIGNQYFGGKTCVGKYNVHARRMLLQTWICDPNVYKDKGHLMVLDPYNWDHKPDPLISLDIMWEEPKKSSPVSNDIPW